MFDYSFFCLSKYIAISVLFYFFWLLSYDHIFFYCWILNSTFVYSQKTREVFKKDRSACCFINFCAKNFQMQKNMKFLRFQVFQLADGPQNESRTVEEKNCKVLNLVWNLFKMIAETHKKIVLEKITCQSISI